MKTTINIQLTFEKPKDEYVLRQMIEVFLKERVEVNSKCGII